MKNFLLTIVLLTSIGVNAQTLHNNQWSIQPKIGVSSWALDGLLTEVENVLLATVADVGSMDASKYCEFWGRNSWYIPEFYYIHPLYNVKSPDGAKVSKPYWWREILWGDYSHSFKINAGYELSWKSLSSPFGAFVGVDWEYTKLMLKDCAEAGNHISQAIVPSVGLRFRMFGGNFEKKWKPALEIGSSYVYNFKYKSPNNYDLKALKNGMRGKVGLGVEWPNEHMAMLLEYQHDFFDHFDKEFMAEDGTMPFKDYKSTFGELSLRASFSF